VNPTPIISLCFFHNSPCDVTSPYTLICKLKLLGVKLKGYLPENSKERFHCVEMLCLIVNMSDEIYYKKSIILINRINTTTPKSQHQNHKNTKITKTPKSQKHQNHKNTKITKTPKSQKHQNHNSIFHHNCNHIHHLVIQTCLIHNSFHKRYISC
jgi:hypothetical protein